MQNVREYFKNSPVAKEGGLAVGIQLARGGIADMDALCALLEEYPDKLLAIRNIGPKSMAVIRSVCEDYCRGKEGFG